MAKNLKENIENLASKLLVSQLAQSHLWDVDQIQLSNLEDLCIRTATEFYLKLEGAK